jgi:Fe-S cluster biogenesis protein NfuA
MTPPEITEDTVDAISNSEIASVAPVSTGNAESAKIDPVKVQEVLDTLRPYLQADGGDCELVDITGEGVVLLKLVGACGSCPSSTITLKMGIEEQLKQHIPGVTEVISV